VREGVGVVVQLALRRKGKKKKKYREVKGKKEMRKGG